MLLYHRVKKVIQILAEPKTNDDEKEIKKLNVPLIPPKPPIKIKINKK